MALRLVSAFTKYEERITSRGLNMYALSCARVGWRKSDEMSRRKIPRAFSGSGNAFGKSGPRILAMARITRLRRGFGVAGKNVDSRSPDRSVASPCDLCSPSNGVPARRIHLNCPLAVQDICSHQSAVFGESIRAIFSVPAPAGF